MDWTVRRRRTESGESEVPRHQLQPEEVKPVAHQEDPLHTARLENPPRPLHTLPGRTPLVLQQDRPLRYPMCYQVVSTGLRLGEAVSFLLASGHHDPRRHARLV